MKVNHAGACTWVEGKESERESMLLWIDLAGYKVFVEEQDSEFEGSLVFAVVSKNGFPTTQAERQEDFQYAKKKLKKN